MAGDCLKLRLLSFMSIYQSAEKLGTLEFYSTSSVVGTSICQSKITKGLTNE